MNKKVLFIKGIYKITNNVDGKVYIGKSINIKRRWKQHINDLDNNKHINKHLQNAWNKYGKKNFKFELLFKSDDEKEIDQKESYYIDLYKSNKRKYGYNLTSGGEGGSRNEETKEKIRQSIRGIGTILTNDDVIKIKLALWCLIDRNDLAKMFKVSKQVIDQIARGASFGYILANLNEDLHHLKQKLIDERNAYILKLYDEGYSIVDISNLTKYSDSIVEKCIYKYRNVVKDKEEKYQKIYDKVFQLYNQGFKKYHIAKYLNISPSTVERYLSGKNNPYKDLPFKKVTKNIQNNIINLYFNKHKTSTEIGDIYNISHSTIMSFINNYKYANTEVN